MEALDEIAVLFYRSLKAANRKHRFLTKERELKF